MNLQRFHPHLAFGSDWSRIDEKIHALLKNDTIPVDMQRYEKEIKSADAKDYHQIDEKKLNVFSQIPSVNKTRCNFSGDTIIFQSDEPIRPDILQKIESDLKSMIPWRKGPFDLYGIFIDAEWQSHMKWNRMKDHLPELENKVVADIGSNSGYYLFKIAQYNPALVMGFDPVLKFKLQFEYIQNFARRDNIIYNMLGWHSLSFFESFYDVIFNMGIIYHHRSPLEILDVCYKALKPGGTMIIETMAIASKKEIALTPGRRYCGTPGVWFIPSESALYNWLRRSRFIDIHTIYLDKLTIEEQRSTEWAPFDSLSDFLDQENSDHTKEGYESPSRMIVLAKKPGR